MSNTWGKNIKVSIFGESHGKAVGVIVDGLPPGFAIDFDDLQDKMKKRAPGGPLATKRKEADEVEILSGFFQGKTTGTPLTGLIKNTDTRSKDYNPNLPRPGTADYSGHVKYKGFNDYRGGGHFSGRITAGLNFAGTIARQILEKEGISIGAHIYSIGDIVSDDFVNGLTPSRDLLQKLDSMDFPVLNEEREAAMKKEIERAAQDGDSVGGIIECAVIGMDPGLGTPFFNSLESSISSMIFSIPGVKGIEFGQGFAIAKMKGSNANDQLYLKEGKILSKTNSSGGINGGISNGLPIVFKTAIRPTASIYKEQDTVNLESLKNEKLKIKGRHDPCIVPRALVVVESAVAICLLDSFLESRC